MRKAALFIVLALVAVSPVFCDITVDDPMAHYMLGYVNAVASFSVSLDEEVFPFDLDGVEVAYNPSYASSILGLRIGQYTLISNVSSSVLYMAHTPLVLDGTDGSEENGKLRQIDYRLYAVVEDHGVVFSSCVSDPNAATANSAINNIEITSNSSMRLVNKSLYVSLDDGNGTTAESVENLKSGTYRSNIYFLLMGE